ncbi:MAG: hypothetical protein IT457_14840 [Planctomycetes bacterium]|nr:hypothetical protein [Planctomycetota bacterium]
MSHESLARWLAPGALLVLVVGELVAQRTPLVDGWDFAPETVAAERPTADWRAVRVPHTFEDELGADFDGTAWYRRTLKVDHGGRHRLLVHAAATATTVWLDGVECGSHLGGWTPFRVELPLRPGVEHRLELRVDERVGHNTQGFLPVIQPHFGGLWRGVELTSDSTPSLDTEHAFAFGELTPEGPRLKLEVPILAGPDAARVRLTATLLDGAQAIATARVEHALATGPVTAALAVPVTAPIRPWSPARPNLYRVRLQLRAADDDAVLQTYELRTGFREVGNRGTTLLWNGEPLQLRGVLHWGYDAPRFAPHDDPARWRSELEAIRALGCNLVKACLWMPPRCFYELADELGLVVWQEYPTWHPKLTGEHRDALRAEYEELHRYDRRHVSVALRSLTCETGHSAELDVVRALFDRCKELVPNTLLVDDSAWISWHRIHDFWDDHPYGNNSTWPAKLAELRQFVAERKALPLILGECIAADTWFEFPEWNRRGLEDGLWWAPHGIGPQREFADLVERRWGVAERNALVPDSRAYALRNRKYQIERLRLAIPDAGYTISVVRDFTKARMGLFDDFGQAKWRAADWDWHRDTLIGLDLAHDRRALLPGAATLRFRVSHAGRGPLTGSLRVAVEGLDAPIAATLDGVRAEPGTVSEALELPLTLPAVDRPRRFRVAVELSGSHPAVNRWELWIVPPADPTPPPELRVVDALDPATLAFVRAGGRALLRAGPRKHCLRTESLWFLKGAPFSPAHAIHARIPKELLLELQSFDLETGLAMRGDQLLEEIDPVLAFWDTHDIDRVQRWLLAFTTQLGEGRLAATTLAVDSPAGRLVEQELLRCLVAETPPQNRLSEATIARLSGELTTRLLPLEDWQLAPDPKDRGLAAGWQSGNGDGAEWRPIRAGAHWESQGLTQYDGVAWYRTEFEVPADWAGAPITAVFDGVDDSFRLYVDGAELGRYGDPATGDSVWLVRTTADLSRVLKPGRRHVLVLRVVDHVGAGGIHKPVRLTTGPIDPRGELLH